VEWNLYFIITEMIDIKDDFLPQKDFQILQDKMVGGYAHYPDFPWVLSGIIRPKVYDPKFTDNLQLCHTFYDKSAPRSQTVEIIYPLLGKINPIGIIRIKANLIMRIENIIEHGMHNDIMDGIGMDYLKTSIFYLNTCNGYTKFEDGTKVESVANRLVTFPQKMKHTGTTCTDEPFRSVINLNYV